MQEHRKHIKQLAYESIDFLKEKFPNLEGTLANIGDLSKTMIVLDDEPECDID